MDFITPVTNFICDDVIKSTKRHASYVLHYKANIDDLEANFGEIKRVKTRIDGNVERSRNNATEIEEDIFRWLKQVDKIENDLKAFLENKSKDSIWCFHCCRFPNVIWRHRLGKGAKEKMGVVTPLKIEGERLVLLPVAHFAPYPQELQFSYSGDFMAFKSRQKVFDEIIDALKDSQCHIIGVHGPGGAGKTMMVKEIAKSTKNSGLFHDTVDATFSRTIDIQAIQDHFATQLNLTFTKHGKEGRAGELWTRLKAATKTEKKNVLVILDDVWEVVNLMEIGIPVMKDGGEGCKVLITSRRERVCKDMGHEKPFGVGVLEEQEALNLFKKVVEDPIVPQFRVQELCKELGGLPVAIVTVGIALRGKGDYTWSDALTQLKNSSLQEIEGINCKVWASLKWSYDYLQHEDAKSCFLICCLFPEDANIPIEVLVIYCVALKLLRNSTTLEEARKRVQTMVDHLRFSSLLLQGKDENHVKMHDIIRDIAILIAKGELRDPQVKPGNQSWLEKQRFLVKHSIGEWRDLGDPGESCSAISFSSNNDSCKLPCTFQCPKLETLLLTCKKSSLEVPNDFFHGMTNLKILDVQVHSWECQSSLAHLVDLRLLNLYTVELGDTAFLKDVKNSLEILRLPESIKELPIEIGELTRLRMLDLKSCRQLRVVPQGMLSKLTSLEELYFPDGFSEWEVGRNASLAELKSLTRLTALYIKIPNAMSFPEELHLEKLIRFQISVGDSLFPVYIPECFTKGLKIKTDESSTDQSLPDRFNTLLHRAEWVNLWGVKGLKNLKSLDRKHELNTFGQLTVLKVEACKSLKYLVSPACALGLLQLVTLEIVDCENIEAIVDNDGETDHREEVGGNVISFNQLKRIKLWNLPNLKSFYPENEVALTDKNNYTTAQSLFNGKVAFPALVTLGVKGLRNLEIWDKHLCPSEESETESFSQLKELSISSCMDVFPTNILARLQNLERLIVNDSHSLTSIPVFPKLRKLYVAHCSTIRSLLLTPAAKFLEKLEIIDCHSLEVIGYEMKDEEELNSSSVVFPQLTHLTLKELQNLKSFWGSLSKSQITFSNQVAFPRLTWLKLDGTSLAFAHFFLVLVEEGGECLREFEVEGCDQVTSIVVPVHLAQKLRKIGKLSIRRCTAVRQVFDLKGLMGGEKQGEVIEPCVDIEFMELSELPQLVCIWNMDPPPGILALQNLKYLHIFDCPVLKNLFSTTVVLALEQIVSISVADCESMEAIIVGSADGEESAQENITFPKLKKLTLSNLPNLESFSSVNCGFNFPLLEKIELKQCPKMQRFSYGEVKIKQHSRRCTNGQKTPRIPDLNEYLEVRASEGEVAFPRLMSLNVKGTSLASTHYFLAAVEEGGECLREFVVERCDQVTSIVPVHSMQKLRKIRKLRIYNCSGVRQVFDLKEQIGGEKQGEVIEPCIDIEGMVLSELPQLVCMWNMDPRGILALQNLKYLRIYDCPILKNLFSTSVALALEQIVDIYVEKCESMEAIIVGSADGEESFQENITFPKLKKLSLRNLPNLESFSSLNDRLNFPLLEEIKLKQCPKMQRFTYGEVKIKRHLRLRTNGQKTPRIPDLNKYLEVRASEREALAVMDIDNSKDNNDEEEEESTVEDVAYLQDTDFDSDSD